MAVLALSILLRSSTQVWAICPDSGSEETPEKRSFFWTTPRLTGEWSESRSNLEESGVSIRFFLVYFFGSSSQAGGIDYRDQSASSDLFVRADLGRLGWVKDGEILMQAKANAGKNINPQIGAISDPIDDADFSTWIYVDQLYYQQGLFDRKFQFRLGYLDLQTIIDRNRYSNSEDTQFSSTLLDNNNVVVPLIVGLGAAFFYTPVDWLTLTGGASDGDNRIRQAGFETAFDGFDSLVLYLESGFKTGIKTQESRLEGNYRFGVFRDAREKAPFDDPEATLERGDYGFYLSFDQELYTEDDPSQGIGIFGRYGRRDASLNKVASSWSVGLQYAGPVPGRDSDTLGFATYGVDASSTYRGFADPSFEGERGFEAYYRIQLTPWLALSPHLQFIQDPGGLSDADDAWVFLFRTRVSF